LSDFTTEFSEALTSSSNSATARWNTVGLTSVHVSRVLRLFRERRIVVLSEGVLEVIDLPALEKIGSLK
jgi:hypothetical protein